MKLRLALSVLILTGLSQPARADVKPHPLFTDGMVLQQNARVPVWGTAGEGERVTVRFRGQERSAVARGGRWRVWLSPLRAGGPDTLVIRGRNTVEIRNVLAGEVWVASGQSNMEWPLRLTDNAEAAIAASADPMLRLFTVKKAVSDSPLETLEGQWQPCGPETAPSFSAVAYYFGRELRRVLGVPVGLIHTSWGGTLAEAWTSRGTLETSPLLSRIVYDYERARRAYRTAAIAYQAAAARHQAEVEAARREGRQPPAPPATPYNPENQNRPSGLYNAMIHPLLPFAIRGAIWYQGESNAGRAWEYQTLYPAMIADWRRAWGQGDFPFYFVQLAPWMAIQKEPAESAWAELREAQRLTELRVPNTGMAVITDVGDERDIHPRKKEPVGRRLAFLALARTYGREEIVDSGPTLAGVRFRNGKAYLTFRNTAGGLEAPGGSLSGFTVAGEDRKFHAAEARIEGRTVVVESPQVPRPVAVRFGWWNFPVVNLYNRAGLPATPFRTDDFPLTTQPK